MMTKPSIETSPLLQRIREALEANAPFKGKLRVSVADTPKWERISSGDEVLVRWACWNLEVGNDEVTEPVFEVLSQDVTREQLAAELPEFFPDVAVEVDNAIEV
jgi:hypothetical protein